MPKDGPNAGNAGNFYGQSDDVFGRIAKRYDLLCDLFSFGIHRLWKGRVASLIVSEPWKYLLDAASGTGDVVLRVLQHQEIRSDQKVVASDVSAEMLAISRRRAANLDLRPEFVILDAHSMPSISDASIDLFSISLGLKICERKRVMREAYRVLRPGGRFITLEASNIRWRFLHRVYLKYMSICMPLIGWVAAGGDRSAYQYLLQGIKEFPTAETLSLEIAEIGFERVEFERLSFGIVAIHVARKPAAASII